MNQQIKANTHREGMAKIGAPIFLCWLAYTTAYLGRYSYNSNMTPIIQAFDVSHGDAGLVTTCFFFAYGIGQVVNGLLCRRYPKRLIVPCSLVISAMLNLAVFMGVPFWTLKYLWLLNGVVQSVLWPTLISVLSAALPSEDLKKSVIIMSTTVPIGTFLAYGLSSLFALSGGFAFSFLTGAVIMGIAAAIWFFSYREAPRRESPVAIQGTGSSGRPQLSSFVIITVFALCFFAVANNLVKDGLTTWVPSILKEKFGLHDSLSIFLTLALPMLGMFGAACNGLLEKKIPSFISLCAIWFLLSSLCIALVLIFVDSGTWWVILAAFGLISLFMYAVNNAITSMAPLYMRDKIDSGLLAGVLNGCCYVGSTISSYGLGSVADHFGWNGVFRLLLAVSCIPMAIALVAGLILKSKEQN